MRLLGAIGEDEKFWHVILVVDVRFCPSHFVVGVRFSGTHFVVSLWSVHVSFYVCLRYSQEQ